MLLLLGIVVFLGISGYNIHITRAAAPSRSSLFTFNNHGGFSLDNDPLSYSALQDHKRNSSVTAEEHAILLSVFAEYDDNDDGLWSYTDFTDFYKDTLRCDDAFTYLDSHTNDGYLDYDELVMILTAFDSVPLFHTEQINELLATVSDVADLPLEEVQAEQPAVLATLIYLQVDHGENGISKEEWCQHMLTNQWQEFNDDMDSFIDFSEFEKDFFQSTTFSVAQECSHEEECTHPQAAYQAFMEAEIVSHDRRRLFWWYWIQLLKQFENVQPVWENVQPEVQAVQQSVDQVAVEVLEAFVPTAAVNEICGWFGC